MPSARKARRSVDFLEGELETPKPPFGAGRHGGQRSIVEHSGEASPQSTSSQHQSWFEGGGWLLQGSPLAQGSVRHSATFDDGVEGLARNRARVRMGEAACAGAGVGASAHAKYRPVLA
jgi:hypothetical protein